MKRSPVEQLAERERVEPPADLSDMPTDPRWRHDAAGWYMPPSCPGGVSISTSTLENRQRLDWWRAYGNAADAVREIARRLAELQTPPKANGRAPRQKRRATPSAPPAAPAEPTERPKSADAIAQMLAQAAMWEH